MKKPIILIIALIVSVVLGIFTYNLINDNGSVDTELIAFSVDNIESIDRLKIEEPNGNKIELIKKGKTWVAADGSCILQENINLILEAIKNIEFKGYLSEDATETFIKKLVTQSKKLEIYQNGEWTKTWYIGPTSQDHLGQIMLLDSEEEGKSDLPVIMKIKGFNGFIDPRFFADQRQWMCTNIFALTPEEITEVDLKFPKNQDRNFNVKSSNKTFKVSHNNNTIPLVDTLMAYRYLKNFEKVNFNIANFELNKKQVDSVKRSSLFCVLTVKEKNGKKSVLKMHSIKTEEKRINSFGVLEDSDVDKMWCELPNKELVKVQFYTFNPIMLGNVYFPELNKFIKE